MSALLNVLLALAIVSATNMLLLAAAVTALGLVWIAALALEMLPFEFQDILPREAAAVYDNYWLALLMEHTSALGRGGERARFYAGGARFRSRANGLGQ